jgi:hypothetical protein
VSCGEPTDRVWPTFPRSTQHHRRPIVGQRYSDANPSSLSVARSNVTGWVHPAARPSPEISASANEPRPSRSASIAVKTSGSFSTTNSAACNVRSIASAISPAGTREARSSTRTVSAFATLLMNPGACSVSWCSINFVANGDCNGSSCAQGSGRERWYRARSPVLTAAHSSGGNGFGHCLECHTLARRHDDAPQGSDWNLGQQHHAAIRMKREFDPIAWLNIEVLPDNPRDRRLTFCCDGRFHLLAGITFSGM